MTNSADRIIWTRDNLDIPSGPIFVPLGAERDAVEAERPEGCLALSSERRVAERQSNAVKQKVFDPAHHFTRRIQAMVNKEARHVHHPNVVAKGRVLEPTSRSGLPPRVEFSDFIRRPLKTAVEHFVPVLKNSLQRRL